MYVYSTLDYIYVSYLIEYDYVRMLLYIYICYVYNSSWVGFENGL